jgi:hypothetical protein
MTMLRRPRLSLGLLLVACTLPWLPGCSDDALTPPDVESDLFESYAALGNSITAGFQSSGINQNTQQESYAVLLAEQMGTPFTIPSLALPGCPPPLAQPFPAERIDDETNCALRNSSGASLPNNVAVPGAAVADVFSNQSPTENPSPLPQLILGGQTQLEAAKRVNPTFLTAWIGNNDVLTAALQGDPNLATPPDSFRARYSRLMDEVGAVGALEGAIFVGIADVTLIPYLSAGAAYRRAIDAGQDAGAFPPNIETQSCAPSESGTNRVPFRHGAALLQSAQGLRRLGSSETITLDCSQDRTVEETIRESLSDDTESVILSRIGDEIRRISLLTAQETSALKIRVETFNQFIRSQIDQADKEYGYVNPNPLLSENSDRIPAFPELFDNPDTPWDSSQPFGPLFSLDGIHPSAEVHRLVTNAIVDEIANTYDVQLSPVSTQ